MQNSTYLTEQFPGLEDALWTPLIVDFLSKHKVDVPVSSYIPGSSSPWYGLRSKNPYINFNGSIIDHPGQGLSLLNIIETHLGVPLADDVGRWKKGCDIAGIQIDILHLDPREKSIYVIENKPYYNSKLDGNQESGESYVEFVKWINSMGISCQYLFIHSIGCCNTLFTKCAEVQANLGHLFGVILLEDLFQLMSDCGYTHPKVLGYDFHDYSCKGNDYA